MLGLKLIHVSKRAPGGEISGYLWVLLMWTEKLRINVEYTFHWSGMHIITKQSERVCLISFSRFIIYFFIDVLMYRNGGGVGEEGGGGSLFP